MRANYRTIPSLLSRRVPFKGNTMRAEVGSTKPYIVYSYSTPIAWIEQDGTVVVNDSRYSVTTSRHQNLCRSYLAGVR